MLPAHFTHFVPHSSAPEVGRAAEKSLGQRDCRLLKGLGEPRCEAGVSGEKCCGARGITGWAGRRLGLLGVCFSSTQH